MKSLSESTLYVKRANKNIVIVSLYVDDLLVTGSNATLIEQFKKEMTRVFEMIDLRAMAFFLGMEIKQNQQGIFICQMKYAKEILKKFQMEECKPMSTLMGQKEKFCKEDGTEKVEETNYRSLIGCLMYLTIIRPDILHAMIILSRFLHCASELYLKVAKRVLRYVKGTLDHGILFQQSQDFQFLGFSDSD
ncbi:uncharacterized mitochondrial protein AtMg00810-like [Hevea brasiliensis]|uniref:uncharacterized mitochondrial protein AtMg00810-like n=1 Tax=Hevea brasiliensis TaxID=3981 RepID=UPI0025F32E28|nr:uncharacterized mitochondrial protein AtMg00810-like [Hevea brasiliensis]